MTPPSDFDQFWALWPDKRNRGAARTAWNQMAKQFPDLLARCRSALEWQAPVMEQRMRAGERQFNAHASTWLRGERWDDEPPVDRLAAHRAPGAQQLYQQWLYDNARWFEEHPEQTVTFEQFMEARAARAH